MNDRYQAWLPKKGTLGAAHALPVCPKIPGAGAGAAVSALPYDMSTALASTVSRGGALGRSLSKRSVWRRRIGRDVFEFEIAMPMEAHRGAVAARDRAECLVSTASRIRTPPDQ